MSASVLERPATAVEASTVPTFTDLSDIYDSGAEAACARYSELSDTFVRRFGAQPDLFGRAPGRVNLIGEHIDYEGYGVLPMAIRADAVVAVRVSGDALDLQHLKSDTFPGAMLPTDPAQFLDTQRHAWTNYFLAAYKGVHEYLVHKGTPVATPGLQILVTGQVPLGGGLSSSSALVVACSIALLAAYGVDAPKADVAAFTCTCERHVGVSSGGMDQAISVMAVAGQAAYVQFQPVRATPVPLPTGSVFVIANSLTVSNKAETSAARYNLRVVECRLAAVMLAAALGTPMAEARAFKTLQEVEPLVTAAPEAGTPAQVTLLDACAAAARSHLHDGAYTADTIESALGCNINSLFADLPASPPSIAWALAHGGYKLRDRAVHVFTEAARVLRFQAVCASSDADEQKLQKLGDLMTASHRSCADAFECSCAELETLIGVAVAAGSVGSRLTGAGWGGCTVHLVREAEVDQFISALRTNYFATLPHAAGATQEELDLYVFASLPSSGAAVYRRA